MRNHIKSRHVDFVLVGNHGEVVCVIGLDDTPHYSEKVKVGDEIKNQIFEYNNMNFYRVKVGLDYRVEITKILTNI